MHGRRRDRLPGRPTRATRDDLDLDLATVAGADVALVGFFSAKEKDFQVLMDDASRVISGLGGRVSMQFVQRRGVSDGGVTAMNRPYSSRTLLGAGKVREIATACEEKKIAMVAFVNGLSSHQRQALSEAFGRPVVSLAEHDYE